MPIETVGLMQIGELAERTGLSLRTIRHYDDEGLLNPSARSSGGFRLYSATDLDRLMVIRRMKPLGFSLEEMRRLLAVLHDLDKADLPPAVRTERAAQLATFIADAHERRASLSAQLVMAEEFIDQLEGISPERG